MSSEILELGWPLESIRQFALVLSQDYRIERLLFRIHGLHGLDVERHARRGLWWVRTSLPDHDFRFGAAHDVTMVESATRLLLRPIKLRLAGKPLTPTNFTESVYSVLGHSRTVADCGPELDVIDRYVVWHVLGHLAGNFRDWLSDYGELRDAVDAAIVDAISRRRFG